MRRRNVGFTLLEILIVLIILGVLAGLAIPGLQGGVERARANEALQRMKMTKDALQRYRDINDTYSGASIPVFLDSNLDFNPNDTVGGQSLHFTYSLRNLGQNTFTIRATRDQYAGCSTIGRIDLDRKSVV